MTNALRLLLLLLALGLLGSGCVSYTVETTNDVAEELVGTRVTALNVGEVQLLADGAKVRLTRTVERDYRVTTTEINALDYDVRPAFGDIWAATERFPILGRIFLILLCSPVLVGVDLIQLLFSTPGALIGGAVRAGDGSPVVAQETRAVGEPIPGGSRPGVTGPAALAGDADAGGWVELAFNDGCREALKRGEDRYVVQLTDPEHSGLTTELQLTLAQMLAMAVPTEGLSELKQRAQLREIHRAAPEAARAVRAAVWKRLEPLEDTLPDTTRLVSLTAAEERVLDGGLGRAIKPQMRIRYTHLAGKRTRYRTAGVRKGVKLWATINGATIEYRPVVDDRGWFNVVLGKRSPEIWLRQGRDETVLTFALSTRSPHKFEWRLPAAQLAAIVDGQITGAPDARLAKWQAIYDACPDDKKKARAAIAKYLQPLKRAKAQRAVDAKELAKLNAVVKRGETFPKTAEARREQMSQRERQGELLAKLGKPKAAARAFGEAARHASDSDDLDALERLINAQIKAKRGR